MRDERDTIFSRADYVRGEKDYNDYYKRNPHKREKDDYIRALPGLGDPKNIWYDDMMHPLIGMGFKFMAELEGIDNEEVGETKVEVDSVEMTKFIKDVLRKMGARARIIEADESLFYDTKGTGVGKYGNVVDKDYKYIIVFSMPKDDEYMNAAPLPKEALATMMKLTQGAYLSTWLSKYLNAIGYKSRANFESNYDFNLIGAAIKAGLGTYGYNGLVIDEEHGPKVKLSAILTDVELVPDAPTAFDVKNVCERCKICVQKCLSKELDSKKGGLVDSDKCYERWRIYGSLCTVCIKSCPFSQTELYNEYKGRLNTNKVIDEFIERHKQTMSKKVPTNIIRGEIAPSISRAVHKMKFNLKK